MTDLLVREMTLADCLRVSRIRIRGWRSAYAGLMPQPYLDGLDVAADAARRAERFGAPGVVNLVAELGGEVVGWACHGPCRDDDARAGDVELYAVYVDPDRIGTGVGRALLRESAGRSAAAGYDRMLLWVLERNTRARRFYERAGLTPDGTEEPFDADGVSVPEVRYAGALADVGSR
ncbi:GNAT family N-acetyltransferase [Streptomyces sp. NPDC088747]|uniref:GNAT family N-acetyltransferase n=1 Tax=Streptomyces sp. NPDC088747 TaxID=3365886 RepID=UPI0037FED042